MTVATSRCPACFARLRSGDPWCGQCLTELRRVTGPPDRPVREVDDRVDDRLGAAYDQLRPLDLATRRANDGQPDDPAGLVDAWTARLAASERGAGRDAWSARLVADTGDRSGRLALAVGGAIALLAGVLVVMALLGSLLL
jgi:hypothetical protein